MTTTITRRLTAEEAVRLDIEGPWELVRGEVVKSMPVQPEHGSIAGELHFRVRTFLGSMEAALIGFEMGFVVARDPDTVRAPDWSLTWREQAEERRRGAWIEGGPNLAVEVVSSNDRWSDLQQKVDEYLAASTELVWVIDPQSRTVHVFRPDAPPRVLRAGDTLTGEPVLPGFELELTELFGGPAEEGEGVRREEP